MKQKNKGFSLIEMLIAIAVLGGISVVLSQSFFTITRSSNKAELQKDIKQSGDFALRIMEQMIRSNESIASCTTDELQIVNPDGNTTTFGCVDDNGVARLASQSGVITSYLTSSNLTLGTTCSAAQLSFACTNLLTSQPDTVKITFSLSQKGTPVDKFELATGAFQTTVNARN